MSASLLHQCVKRLCTWPWGGGSRGIASRARARPGPGSASHWTQAPAATRFSAAHRLPFFSSVRPHINASDYLKAFSTHIRIQLLINNSLPSHKKQPATPTKYTTTMAALRAATMSMNTTSAKRTVKRSCAVPHAVNRRVRMVVRATNPGTASSGLAKVRGQLAWLYR